MGIYTLITNQYMITIISTILQLLGTIYFYVLCDLFYALVIQYKYRCWIAWAYPSKTLISVRKKWSANTRARIEVKQRYRCPKCYQSLPAERDLDHIRPLHLMGADEEYNLQVLDGLCHNAKTRGIDTRVKNTIQKNQKRK